RDHGAVPARLLGGEAGEPLELFGDHPPLHPALGARLAPLTDLEALMAAGIPAITSQSVLKGELTGAGYAPPALLMTPIGSPAEGDVIPNAPASPSDEAVRRVYKRREWENIWLRTKRYNASG
ncbi:hypothetical protein ADL02_18625, partial [Streptomyces sp. NRRL WC-3723]